MTDRLLLVDYENVHRVDLSSLNESYRAIVFLGAGQDVPKAMVNKATAHRFKRVEFQKISGRGKNALDFHIAFRLGRIFETRSKSVCFIVSRDKGFDPLVDHVQKAGLNCRRVDSFEQLYGIACGRCSRDATIDHAGGRWCGPCGAYAVEPDPKLLPVAREADDASAGRFVVTHRPQVRCDWCRQLGDTNDGIFDDGEWMCAACLTTAPDSKEE